MKLKIEFAKNKCLSTIWSLLEIIIQESIIKTLILCDFTIQPPLGLWSIFFNTFFTPGCERCDVERIHCKDAVIDVPLYRYKRNWVITCDLPES